MPKTYKLDHFTKGTGATVVPADEREPETSPRKLHGARLGGGPRKERTAGSTVSSALPPGHVRKKATGEIGRVQSVDSKSGTARVLWLRHGQVSTVPLSALSRR